MGRSEIMRLFMENVKYKPIDIHACRHFGKEGHWLETKMGIPRNSQNSPDLLGYEMKHDSRKRITLGDYSASEYLFSKKRNTLDPMNQWSQEVDFTKPTFLQCFGNPNPEKEGRYAWSGRCVPSYHEWNSNGQTLTFNEENDLMAMYSYEKDVRPRKKTFPECIKKDLVIAIWKSDKLQQHIDKKFNQKGFFICYKNGDTYDHIRFGRAFDYAHFIHCVKNKTIVFDSGMHEGNARNYSMFRGTKFWKDLLI